MWVSLISYYTLTSGQAQYVQEQEKSAAHSLPTVERVDKKEEGVFEGGQQFGCLCMMLCQGVSLCFIAGCPAQACGVLFAPLGPLYMLYQPDVTLVLRDKTNPVCSLAKLRRRAATNHRHGGADASWLLHLLCCCNAPGSPGQS